MQRQRSIGKFIIYMIIGCFLVMVVSNLYSFYLVSHSNADCDLISGIHSQYIWNGVLVQEGEMKNDGCMYPELKLMHIKENQLPILKEITMRHEYCHYLLNSKNYSFTNVNTFTPEEIRCDLYAISPYPYLSGIEQSELK